MKLKAKTSVVFAILLASTGGFQETQAMPALMLWTGAIWIGL